MSHQCRAPLIWECSRTDLEEWGGRREEEWGERREEEGGGRREEEEWGERTDETRIRGKGGREKSRLSPY